MSNTQQALAPIEILLVSDSKYAAFLATTVVSILDSAAPDDSIHFHIVDGGMTTADLQKIESLKDRRPCEMSFYKPDLKKYLKYFRKDILTFPVVVNYRLFLAQYLPATIDKILYLDVDVVATTSLRELWETPLDDAFLAAVPDRDIDPKHVEKLPLEGYKNYFNSGVLLFNVKKWREETILKEMLDVCMEIKDIIEFPDQDVLNVYAARTRYAQLDPRWNCHPKYYDDAIPGVVHYMGNRAKAPRLELLFDNAAKTPYRRLPMQTRLYRFKRMLRKKRTQLVCLFLWKREWRHDYRKRMNYR